MESPMDESNLLLDELWEKMMGAFNWVTGYVIYVFTLVVKKLEGIQHVARTIELSYFSRLFKD
jgi:hypothetical protein